MSGELPIGGSCDARFARVREAFVENFTRHGERGGAVTVALHGKPVVDLWGGYADVARTKTWEEDTIVNVFSVCKALNAIAVLRLAEQGKLDLDAPVAHYWPEFAANGKGAITVRTVLAHRAGLVALRDPLPDTAMLDWAYITQAIANEKPWWEPGTAHGYHVNTFGFLTGEIVRRVSGKSIGRFLRDEVWTPLEADMHIGAPAHTHHRVAEFQWPGSPPKPEFADDHELMRWNAYWNPAGFSGGRWVNTKEWRAAEVPSTNGHANARSIARVYSALAAGGTIDGISVLSKDDARRSDARTFRRHRSRFAASEPFRSRFSTDASRTPARSQSECLRPFRRRRLTRLLRSRYGLGLRLRHQRHGPTLAKPAQRRIDQSGVCKFVSAMHFRRRANSNLGVLASNIGNKGRNKPQQMAALTKPPKRTYHERLVRSPFRWESECSN